MRNANIFGLGAIDLVSKNPAASRAVRNIPFRQYSHLPQAVMQEMRTRSPGLKRRNTGADAVHHANALMTEDATGFTGRNITLENVQIGSANGRVGDLYDRIGGAVTMARGSAPTLSFLALGTPEPSSDERRPLERELPRQVSS